MKNHVQIKLLGLVVAFLLVLQCGAPISREKRIIPVIPYQDKRFSPGEKWNSISVKENQLTITVKYLEPEELALFSARIRPPHWTDFAPLFSGKYINYADEGYEDMLIAYNLYSQTPASLLFNELGKSPFYYGWRDSPYLDENAVPHFTAFMITFENNGEEKVGFDPTLFVVVDDQGQQQSALSYEQALTTSVGFGGARGLRPGYPYSSWARYGYNLFGARYLIRSHILAQTLLKEKRVYPKARVQGIVLFPRLDPRVKNFRLILPEVIFFKGNREKEKLDFQFDFWAGEIK